MDKKTAILLLVVFIDLVGFGLVIPIMPLLINKVGGGTILVGVILALFSLFQFVFAPILGRLSDKYGRKPVLIISSFINSISYIMIFFSQQIWILALARILAGIGSSNISVAQAYIADTSTSHERTKKLGFLGAAFGLGFIVGPVLGGVLSSKFSIQIAFLVPAILSFINTILIFAILPESNKSLQKHIKIELFNLKVTKEVLKPKNIAFLMVLFSFVSFALSLMFGVFALLGQARFGWGTAQNGYFFGLIGVVSFITQAFLIRLMLKRFNEVSMIKFGLLTFGSAILVMGLSPWVWLTIIAGGINALGVSFVMINTQSLISQESKAEEQGIVLGVTQSFSALGRVFGPLLGGLLAVYALSLPFIISGLVTALIFIFGYKYLKFMSDSRKSSVN